MLKNYRKIKKKLDNDVDTDMAQQKHSNNKCYASAFRYIHIQMSALEEWCVASYALATYAKH